MTISDYWDAKPFVAAIAKASDDVKQLEMAVATGAILARRQLRWDGGRLMPESFAGGHAKWVAQKIFDGSSPWRWVGERVASARNFHTSGR